MNITHEIRGDILIIRPSGRIDSTTALELERAIGELLEAGSRRLILSLGDVGYVSSAGLRAVLITGKKMRAAQGKLVLVGMREMVHEVFEMSGFLKIFTVVETLEEGVAAV